MKILNGQAATMKVASGKIVLTNEEAIKSKTPVILFKHHTIPDDLPAIVASNGIVTMVGGTLSHAPIVAREFGKACLIACEDLQIDLENNVIQVGDKIIPAGTEVIVNGKEEGVYLK